MSGQFRLSDRAGQLLIDHFADNAAKSPFEVSDNELYARIDRIDISLGRHTVSVDLVFGNETILSFGPHAVALGDTLTLHGFQGKVKVTAET